MKVTLAFPFVIILVTTDHDKIVHNMYTYENVDELLTTLNGYGQFQKILTVVFAILMIPSTFHFLIMYFVAAKPSWKCSPNSKLCHFNGTLPGYNMARCTLPPDQWQYVEPTTFSIITDFNLDCKKEWIVHVATSVTYFGAAIGAMMLGMLTHALGRKPIIFTSFFIVIITGFVSSFVTNIKSFIVFRYVIGLFSPPLLTGLFMLLGEMVDNQHRPFACIIVSIGVSTSWLVLGLKANFIRNWRHLIRSCSLPYIVLLFSFKFVPESIRWLHIRNYRERLYSECTRIAKWNKVRLPPDYEITEQCSRKKTRPLILFQSCSSTRTILILMYAWGIGHLVYFALYYTADKFGINMHLNFILMTLTEIPANLLAAFCSGRYGRRITCLTIMLIGSISTLLIVPFHTNQYLVELKYLLGMIGLGSFTASICCLVTWTVEILSTDVRPIGLAVVQVANRLCTTGAPWVSNGLVSVLPVAPFLAIGLMGLSIAALMFYLPETKGISMQDDSGHKDMERIPLKDNSI